VANFLSIDVEDYFQVAAFEKVSPPGSWTRRELRVSRNTEKILQILDREGCKATFFILGWVAQRCKGLVRSIADCGHEVASHGYWHQRVGCQDRILFRQDVVRSKGLLEDISGQPVLGYRAPSYSISPQTPWAFDELHAAGYKYDSSIFPIRHDLYGFCEFPRFASRLTRGPEGGWAVADPATAHSGPSLLEIPITTLNYAGRNIPIAGGGYFRLNPYSFTRWGLRRINRVEKSPFVFYLHPWELDPEQPRMRGVGVKSRIRHYLNLGKPEHRFRRLLRDFQFSTMREALVANASVGTSG